ncbi:MAG: GPW/gp25 family protein [Culturomica sp.]|jgi:phage baseplate assembly protein W|nr:GPW/gp25 family protein [Culturomica sp.]
MINKKSFLGRGWSFPPQFNKDENTTSMVENDEDVKQSLELLLSTLPGERIHRFDYGCTIRQFMYEPMNATTQTLMKEIIEIAIIRHEPRISLNRIGFDMTNEKEGIIYIVIDYTVLMTNRRSNIVYPFYLREGTDVDL